MCFHNTIEDLIQPSHLVVDVIKQQVAITGHLEQAGEAKDFVNVKTSEEKAPKAIFPTFIPGNENNFCPDFLHTFPFSSDRIELTKEIQRSKLEQNFQIEPECAIIFDAKWQNDKVISLKPLCFGASNDCSIILEVAKKISMKKNCEGNSKVFTCTLIPDLTEGIDNRGESELIQAARGREVGSRMFLRWGRRDQERVSSECELTLGSHLKF